MNVALYTRVSTEDQAKEGFSLDAQLDRLRLYCRSKDWSVFNEYVDDGYSGRDIRRPAYIKMISEIEKWDLILVLKMDRVHRNSKNFMFMMEELGKRNKGFVSVMESLDTSTAIGRFVVDIIQRIAQLESEQIGERVYMGMRQKAKSGDCRLGFNIPYGYDFLEGNLIINHFESKIIKRIFGMFLDGLSYSMICSKLNNEGVKTKRGSKWKSGTIGSILHNPVYCGVFRWNEFKSKGSHKKLISIKDFKKVQDEIGLRGGVPCKVL